MFENLVTFLNVSLNGVACAYATFDDNCPCIVDKTTIDRISIEAIIPVHKSLDLLFLEVAACVLPLSILFSDISHAIIMMYLLKFPNYTQITPKLRMINEF
jgi:hypothetical protein